VYRFRKFARQNKTALVTTTAGARVVLLAVAGLATSTVLITRERSQPMIRISSAGYATHLASGRMTCLCHLPCGLVYEDDSPRTLAEVLTALEQGLRKWFEEEGIEVDS
jgi:hypothetical protein